MVRKISPDTGYVTVNGRQVWRPSPDHVRAEITSGLYGEDFDYLDGQLDDLVKAVQRECAAQIREAKQAGSTRSAADMIDPDKEK